MTLLLILAVRNTEITKTVKTDVYWMYLHKVATVIQYHSPTIGVIICFGVESFRERYGIHGLSNMMMRAIAPSVCSFTKHVIEFC